MKIFENIRISKRIRIVTNIKLKKIFEIFFGIFFFCLFENIRKSNTSSNTFEYFQIVFENIRFLPNKPKKQIFLNKNMKIFGKKI